MNYALFYKMIKEASSIIDAGRNSAIAPNPASVRPSTPVTTSSSKPQKPAATQTPQAPSATAPLSSTPPFTPTQPAAQNLNSTYPQSVDQLVDGWIQQKQHYYRGRVDKYPQYANYTVSPEAQRGMRRQAEEIFKKYKTPEAREAYFQQHPEMLGHNGAFNYASIANSRYIAKVNAPAREARRQAEEARKVQQQPMQNPAAPAAIPNPAPYTPLTSSQIIERGVPIMEREFRSGWSPDSTSPQAYDFRNRMRLALREIMPNVPEEQRYWRFLELLQNNGIKGFGSDFLNNAITQMSNGYWDSLYGDSYINLSPEDRFKVSQNISFNNIMQNPDGTYRPWNTLSQQ